MERTDTFNYDGEEYEFSYEISPDGDDWDVLIHWIEKGNQIWGLPPEGMAGQAVEVAKLWADENFDKEEYYEERRYHGIDRV